ncbi:MAG: methyltransferase domain-containing protein [Planctomycetes bacterium]|nr:methyltransferase domain-containing protein [Planctomycetota bacterium]MCB9869026.1 methyltransferase domain-containing protein [Planctomycetota bacterium]MCB9887986.1 methyltransferase domain-containing protein [Planctomycetota bacterium]
MQNPEAAVAARYSDAARTREGSLCCPVQFNAKLLEVLPAEVLERDYGCGDPTPYVKPGDVVLDLGCGGGKVCWIAAQIAGPEGRVIGVDMNTDMLALARAHHHTIAERVGFDTVTFRRGMIQDLALDLDLLEQQLRGAPVGDAESWLRMRQIEDRLRADQPMVPDESVDVVLSNCVLNLVRPQDKVVLFREIHRVVKTGGRVAISDIVADEDIPAELQADPELWSGCISGAFREDAFLEAFEAAGFHGIEIVKRDAEPWQTVQGIEFRGVTVRAFKGKAGPCLERNQALVYNGPFREVRDDDGHTFPRGARMAVCDKTFRLLQREPYAGMFSPVPPRIDVPLESARPFPCDRDTRRSAAETKGAGYAATSCGSSGCC